jgi:predicted RNA-binding protein YlxR (DUF448 family)
MKTKKIPMRRCIGCMESKPKKDLVRLVLNEEGTLLLDPSGRANGRGAYLCPDPACFAAARKRKAFARCFEAKISDEALDRLAEEFDKEVCS